MQSDPKTPKLITYLLPKQGSKVFLVQYKDSPNSKRSGWWIPSPELNYGEHPEDCAGRMISSLGIKDHVLAFKGIDSFVTKDWHILFMYVAETAEQPKLSQTYERGEWFDINDLPEAASFAHGNWERNLVQKLVGL